MEIDDLGEEMQVTIGVTISLSRAPVKDFGEGSGNRLDADATLLEIQGPAEELILLTMRNSVASFYVTKGMRICVERKE